jgi:hypothetical protein
LPQLSRVDTLSFTRRRAAIGLNFSERGEREEVLNAKQLRGGKAH